MNGVATSSLDLYDSCIRSFLGPKKGNKLIDDGGETKITNCAAEYFHELCSENPLHQLIEASLHSFHDSFGCGTATLLSMFYFWHQAFKRKQLENWYIRDVMKELEKCLQLVFDSVDTIVMSFHSNADIKMLSNLVRGLSRNDQVITSSLEKLWQNQISDSVNKELFDLSRLDVSLISTIICRSAASKSCVVPGILLKVNQEAMELILRRTEDSKWCILLINGNLTQKFSHKGINLSLKTAKITVGVKSLENSNLVRWTTELSDKLKMLQVDCVLVSGKIDQDLALYLYSKGVVLISHAGARVLEIVANHTGAKAGTYVADCDQLNIAQGLRITCSDFENAADSSFVVLKSQDMIFQTFVICHPIPSQAHCLDHRFWHVVRRLEHVCQSQKYLPGNGVTEQHALNSLVTPPSGSSELYTVCCGAMEEAFRCYVDLAARADDRGSHESDVPIVDDYTSKLAAWRSAFRLACLLLRTDTMVVTGDADSQTVQRFTDNSIQTVFLGNL